MYSQNERIAVLIGRHYDGSITEPEGEELQTWINAAEANRLFFEQYQNDTYIHTELQKHDQYDVQAGWEKLAMKENLPRPRRTIRMRWFFAAAAILLLGLMTWVLINKPATTKRSPAPLVYKNDVAPGGDRARLILADGRVIMLDNARDGALAQEGGAKVIKLNGQLTYQAVGSRQSAVAYNTLSTPRGGEYVLELPDGSKVWLNAASSIKYPTQFTGNERRVDITGEAYFEVAKSMAPSNSPGGGGRIPFRVYFSAPGHQPGYVEVLGTHFNVNAYEDEAAVKTTLLEGKVKVASAATQPETKNNKPETLLPGQQAQLNTDGNISVTKDINTDEIVAWKEGNFQFSNASMETILRTISRWYDVQVKFESKPTELYRVKLSRSVPISKLLQYLELTGGVKFGVDGKTVTVSRAVTND